MVSLHGPAVPGVRALKAGPLAGDTSSEDRGMLGCWTAAWLVLPIKTMWWLAGSVIAIRMPGCRQSIVHAVHAGQRAAHQGTLGLASWSSVFAVGVGATVKDEPMGCRALPIPECVGAVSGVSVSCSPGGDPRPVAQIGGRDDARG